MFTFWGVIYAILGVIYVVACLGLIIIVLLQKGKGAGFAGAFGVGAGTDAVFGPRGGRSLPQRITTIMAAVFMTLAFVMSLIAGRVYKGEAPERVTVEEMSAASQRLEELGLGSETGGVAPTPTSPAAEQPASTPIEVVPAQDSASQPPAEAPAEPVAPAEAPAAESAPAN